MKRISLSYFEFGYNDSLAFKTYFMQEMLIKGAGFHWVLYVYAHTEQVLDKYFTVYYRSLPCWF